MDKLKQTFFELCRILTGIIFLFSGFAKAVDTIGGAIKIEDYIVAWGFELPSAVYTALSLLLNTAEFMTGFMLLFKLYVPLASLVALLFMVCFTPLTLYIAIANPVSDCGCFGDAVKLSNWGTFAKNVVILPIAIMLFVNRRSLQGRMNAWRTACMTGGGLLAVLLTEAEGLTNEPIIDFRPYAVGTDIRKAMEIPADAEQPEYETKFVMRKDGVEKTFDVNDYPYNDSTWVYVDTKTTIIREGYTPPIKDFTFTDRNSEPATEHLLGSESPIMMAIVPSVAGIDTAMAAELRRVSEVCLNSGIEFYVATSSSAAEVAELENRASSGFDVLWADETMLKTIVRSYPGFVLMQGGVVVGKYSAGTLPYDSDLATPLATSLRQQRLTAERAVVIVGALALMILFLSIYKKHKR